MMSDVSDQPPDPTASAVPQLQQALTRLVETVLVRPDEDSAMLDLPIRQIKCLQLIAAHEGQKLRELAARLALPLPSVSRLVERLVHAGLVARHTDPGDRRAVRLETTPQSRSLLAQHQAVREAHLAACVRRLSLVDLSRVLTGLDLLADAGQEALTARDAAAPTH